MRICIEKSTGKLIEAQTGGAAESDLEPLHQNALAAGYPSGDLETRYVTEEEFETLLAARHAAEQTYADKRRREYPPMADYLDARVKQASPDPSIREAGRLQETAYYTQCLTVKERYPKPE